MCNEEKMGYSMYSISLLNLNFKAYTTDLKVTAKGNRCLFCLYSDGLSHFLRRCLDTDFVRFIWNILTVT